VKIRRIEQLMRRLGVVCDGYKGAGTEMADLLHVVRCD